jgi:hypothetical protein
MNWKDFIGKTVATIVASAITASLLLILGIILLFIGSVLYALTVSIYTDFPLLSTAWGTLFILSFMIHYLLQPLSIDPNTYN